MTDKPENQEPDFDPTEDELSQPPRPEQIWPPPPVKKPSAPPQPNLPEPEGEPIELDWEDDVEKLDDVIEEIRKMNEDHEAIRAAAALDDIEFEEDETPIAEQESSPAPVQVTGKIDGRIRRKSEGEIAQLWSNVFFSAERAPPRAIVVAAARRGDGATQIATCLALMGAESNREVRIALVDFDLRQPDMAGVLGLASEPGVTDVLSGKVNLDRAVQAVSTEGGGVLHFLPAGSRVDQPLALLRSRQVKAMIARLKDRYDHVIMDVSTPSVHPDAQIIGSMVDGAILVVRSGQTPRETVAEVKKRLDLAGVNCLGVVLNQRSDPIPSLVYRMT